MVGTIDRYPQFDDDCSETPTEEYAVHSILIVAFLIPPLGVFITAVFLAAVDEQFDIFEDIASPADCAGPWSATNDFSACSWVTIPFARVMGYGGSASLSV